MEQVSVILGAEVTPGARAAVSLAVRRFGGRWTSRCAGEATARYALAAGARLVDSVGDFDALLVAFDDEQAAAVAEAKNAALVFDVVDILDTIPLSVVRDRGRGDREILDITGAAVLGISEEASNELYVSRYRRNRVEVPPVALAPGTAWEPLRPRTRTGDLAARTAGTATRRAQALLGFDEGVDGRAEHIVVSDAATCAAHLLRYLSHHGFLDRALAGPGPVHAPAPPTASGDRPTPEVSGRGPRPIDAPARGADRRPIPLRTFGQTARGPRRLGQSAQRNIRGPFRPRGHDG
jgi:hypothetical protein